MEEEAIRMAVAMKREQADHRALMRCYRNWPMSLTDACLVGLLAAILFLLTLMAGEIDSVVRHSTVLAITGSVSAFVGLLLVIVGAVLVIMDASYAHRQLDAGLLDVPDLAQRTGQTPGWYDISSLETLRTRIGSFSECPDRQDHRPSPV